MVLTSKLRAGDRLDQEFVVHVVDDVLMPVLRKASKPPGFETSPVRSVADGVA